MSRFVNGAARMQPITMLTGQAAGAIAALAAIQNIVPRNVNILEVQEVLVNAGSRLNLKDFSDVERSNPYWPYVQIVAVNKLMNGYTNGNFGVNDNLSRAQAGVVLANAVNWDLTILPGTPAFSDVPAYHWAFPYAETMYRLGITSGCGGSPKSFVPTTP